MKKSLWKIIRTPKTADLKQTERHSPKEMAIRSTLFVKYVRIINLCLTLTLWQWVHTRLLVSTLTVCLKLCPCIKILSVIFIFDAFFCPQFFSIRDLFPTNCAVHIRHNIELQFQSFQWHSGSFLTIGLISAVQEIWESSVP